MKQLNDKEYALAVYCSEYFNNVINMRDIEDRKKACQDELDRLEQLTKSNQSRQEELTDLILELINSGVSVKSLENDKLEWEEFWSKVKTPMQEGLSLTDESESELEDVDFGGYEDVPFGSSDIKL